MAWCTGDDITCNQLAGVLPVEAIARLIGKPVRDIVQHRPDVVDAQPRPAPALSVPDRHGCRYGVKELGDIVAMLKRGVPVDDVARRTQRTARAVLAIQYEFLPATECGKRPYTSDEVNKLREMHARDIPFDRIGRALGRTATAVRKKASEIGLPNRGPRLRS